MKVLGIDIGGTFIKVISKENETVIKDKVRIEETYKTSENFINLIKAVIEKHKPDRVGIAVAGLVDKSGRITNSPNLRYIENISLKDALQKSFNIPVLIGNDANLAAYGEYIYGAGKDSKILICLTLGTGLGGGAVVEGKILEGVSGCGMEIGHMVVEKDGDICNCGRRGCLEAYVSSYGVERIYRKLTGSQLSSFEIINLAKKEDSYAIKTFDIFVDYLSIGIMNLAHIFNPDKILIAGGVVENYPKLIEDITKKSKQIMFPCPASALNIEMAELGSWSGAYGAVALAEKSNTDYSS